MGFAKASLRPYSAMGEVGVAFKTNLANQNHVGLLFRLPSGQPQLIHLETHHKLTVCDPPENHFVWDNCGYFNNDSTNERVFAARMLSIAKKKKIPYGVAHKGDAFSKSGKFLGFPEEGMGLTCATFVIAVFHSYGYIIVDTETWEPRDDDLVWQEEILTELEEHGYAPAKYIQAAKEFVNGLRYRPEEVAVAAANNAPPITFKDAKTRAAELLKLVGAKVV